MRKQTWFATVLLALSILACGQSQGAVQTAIAETQASWTPTPMPATPTLQALPPTQVPTQAAAASNPVTATAASNCYRWDQVTADMNGQVTCVRGVIYGFTQARNVGTRYSFTGESSHFFLYSARWEFYNPKTGKTLAKGTCIQVTAPIRLQSGVPYINLDDIAGETAQQVVKDFQFFDDTSSCQ